MVLTFDIRFLFLKTDTSKDKTTNKAILLGDRLLWTRVSLYSAFLGQSQYRGLRLTEASLRGVFESMSQPVTTLSDSLIAVKRHPKFWGLAALLVTSN